MPRRVFYSFHYEADNWRASQLRNIGTVEGNPSATDNDWECITRQGDRAIQNWINNQLIGRSCTIVLIGQNTAERKWVNYEIQQSMSQNKGIFGIYIHNLKNRHGYHSFQGRNPFEWFTSTITGHNYANIIRTYNPPYTQSTDVYRYISENIQGWIELAINQIRGTRV